eukprot:TRINITY_DN83085_c0_g1_i1.p1 TRINITY_DN83085_c0_g1~~TRINITY_DN83085_c0_g1_i1.p1  ORF type:complete len:271 (+),score=34.13 TRINITY_DN83085_c0_g1_i1:114-926(+)
MAGHQYEPLAKTGSVTYHAKHAGRYDVEDSIWQGFARRMDIARSESMEITNDPRFFSDNVIDKRLAAFGGLSIVSGLMLDTSMSQCFSLDKNMDFTFEWPYMGYIQMFGFLAQMTCTFLCIISLYTVAHQFFYTYRLMTSGPTGFESACLFYLNRTIVMWRHFSIKCLFNGLWLFMFASGVQLIVKFYKDAASSHPSFVEPELDLNVHLILAFFVLSFFIGCAVFLCRLRSDHCEAFAHYYETCQGHAQPITQTMRDMQTRGSLRAYLDN